MKQIDLFSYLEEQKPIGKVVLDKKLLLSMLQTIDSLSGNFNYYVNKGVWYAISTLEHMAVYYRSKVLSLKGSKHSYFTIDAHKIKELVNAAGKDNIELNVYEGAVSVFSKRVARAFLTHKDETANVVNINNILKSNNYTKVKVDVDKLISAVKWVKGTGKVKHERASFVIRDGNLMIYDFDVGKDGKFDEAKAIIGNVVESAEVSSVYNTNYLDVVSKFLSRNKDSIKSLYLYLCTDYPLIVRGKIGLGGKMKDVSNDMKFDFIIAPILTE